MEERNERLICALIAGRRALFVPGCWPVERRFFACVNPFHAGHVQELKMLHDLPNAKKKQTKTRMMSVRKEGQEAWQDGVPNK